MVDPSRPMDHPEVFAAVYKCKEDGTVELERVIYIENVDEVFDILYLMDRKSSMTEFFENNAVLPQDE